MSPPYGLGPAQRDEELLAYYRHVIALRHKHAALRTESVWTCDDLSGQVYTVIHGKVTVRLAAYEGAIITPLTEQ